MKNNFRHNLKSLREGAGITQPELAKKAGVSKAVISHWENGLREPGMTSLILLADCFEISIDELVGRDTQIIKPKK